MDNLQKNIAELSAKLPQVGSSSEFTQKIAVLETELVQAKKKNEELQVQIQSYEQTIAELQNSNAEKADLVGQIHHLKEEFTDSEKIISELRTENENQEIRVKLSSNALYNSIPLHKKFGFLNELFDNNRTEFNEAIILIHESENYNEAIKLIEKYYRNYNWDLENPTVQDFYKYVSHRF